MAEIQNDLGEIMQQLACQRKSCIQHESGRALTASNQSIEYSRYIVLVINLRSIH